MHYFIKCWTTHYCTFAGRARRAEYWQFSLISGLVTWLVQAILVMSIMMLTNNEILAQVASLIVSLLAICPSVGVQVRRMHDIGRSAWALCWGLVPIVGAFIILYFMCKDSEPGTNKYGVSEKYPNGLGVAG